MNLKTRKKWVSGNAVYAVLIVALLLLVVLSQRNSEELAIMTGNAVNVVNAIDKVEVSDIGSAVKNGDSVKGNLTERNVSDILNVSLMKSGINYRILNRTNLTNMSVNASSIDQAVEASIEDTIDMKNSGFSIVYMTDQLIEMQKAIKENNFAEVIRIADLMGKRKERAYYLSDLINAIDLEIQDEKQNDINVSGAQEIINLAVKAFDNEQYDNTEDLLKQTSQKLDKMKADVTMIDVIAKSSRGFFARNWKRMLVMIFIILVAAAALYKPVESFYIRKKLAALRTERDVIKKLINTAQQDHFKNNTLSGPNYKIKMDVYKKRLEEIKETLPVLESEVKKE